MTATPVQGAHRVGRHVTRCHVPWGTDLAVRCSRRPHWFGFHVGWWEGHRVTWSGGQLPG